MVPLEAQSTPTEEIENMGDLSRRAEDAQMKIYWDHLRSIFDDAEGRARNQYGEELQTHDASSVSEAIDWQPRLGGWKYDVEQAAVWKIQVGEKEYTCPQIKATIGEKTGRFIILPDGTAHHIKNEIRSGENDLHLDGELELKAVTTASGESPSLIEGLIVAQETVRLSNHNKKHQEQGVHGFGTIAQIGGQEFRVASAGLTELDSPERMLETLEPLHKTFYTDSD